MIEVHYLLVEDEAPAAARFQKLMKPNPSFVSMGTAASGAEALAILKEKTVDVVFLDIELPDMSGFDLLDKIPDDRRPIVVFVTAYDKYALLAFEYFAIDYLLKPFSNARFQKMISRIPGGHRQNLEGLTESIRRGDLPGTIVVKTGKRHHFISIADITWVGADGNYCDIHVESGEVHVHRETILRMMEILPKEQFIRIHHSYVVRRSFIKGVNSILFGDMEVVLKDDSHLKVSRTYKSGLRDLLHKR